MGESIAIVIVSQRPLLREGLASLLQNSRFRVIASAASGPEIKDVRISSGRRVLSIVGIDDSDKGIIEAAENIKFLRLRFAETKIVLVAEIRGPLDIQQIVALTPNGYIANLCSRDILLRVIDLALLDQQAFVCSESAPFVIAAQNEELDKHSNPRSVDGDHDGLNSRASLHNENPRLSDREQQILARLAKGNSNKEIARIFHITESTVKAHLKAILRKIVAHNRTQAAIWAIARGYNSSRGSSEESRQLTPVSGIGPLSHPLTSANGVRSKLDE